MAPEALFGKSVGFEIEVSQTWDLMNDSSIRAVRFGIDIARSKVDVDPTRLMSIKRREFLLVFILVGHFENGSGEYELRNDLNE